ncbi:hypothetical protein IVA96_15700 [Bradyrhizobium sp. 159]|uniref:hypothetical protein n=1 Tax=unclassified Bradyrhizobium TaxID=2631580 RepID=UPI001FF7CE91|nr:MULTISPECIES: hypothetical protein [unclassified Bradyrhizobium]MCK1424603.1 hypothetical protein [Bradyrhizobium sp. CW12]MCK1618063.1 hypothetical protein [Bradyrhizobium sp. 159]MCK1646466.1 hypothetical protein [Bradyrhizobium sp. 154]
MMTNVDKTDWETGEHREPIKPVAPSPRGRPPKLIQSTAEQTNDAVADDQGHRDETQ